MDRSREHDWIRALGILLKYSFLLLIGSLGFLQLTIPIYGQELVSTDLLFLLTAALYLTTVVLRQKRPRWHNFYYLLIIYLLALSSSVIFSPDSYASLGKLAAECYLVALCVLTLQLAEIDGQLRLVVKAWLAGTAFVVTVGIATVVLYYLRPGNDLLDYLTYHHGAAPTGNFPRITATFVSASMFCNYLNIGFVLTLAAWKLDWIGKTAAATLIVTILICATFTVSIGLGGVFLAAGLWYWTVIAKPAKAVRLAALLTSLLAATVFLITSLFALQPYPGGEMWGYIPFTHIPLMPSSRFMVWRDASAMFFAHPLTGNGLGLPVANVYYSNSDGSVSLLTDAHNVFLSVAAQSGFPALVAIGLIFAYVLKESLVVLSRDKLITAAIGLGLVCSFIYQGLLGSFEDARHLWVLMGMFLAAQRIDQANAQNS